MRGTVGSTGATAIPSDLQPSTHFLLLRDASIYFVGSPADLLSARDPYVQRFLA